MMDLIGQYFPQLVLGVFSLFALVFIVVSINDNLRGPVR